MRTPYLDIDLRADSISAQYLSGTAVGEDRFYLYGSPRTGQFIYVYDTNGSYLSNERIDFNIFGSYGNANRGLGYYDGHLYLADGSDDTDSRWRGSSTMYVFNTNGQRVTNKEFAIEPADVGKSLNDTYPGLVHHRGNFYLFRRPNEILVYSNDGTRLSNLDFTTPFSFSLIEPANSYELDFYQEYIYFNAIDFENVAVFNTNGDRQRDLEFRIDGDFPRSFFHHNRHLYLAERIDELLGEIRVYYVGD